MHTGSRREKPDSCRGLNAEKTSHGPQVSLDENDLQMAIAQKRPVHGRPVDLAKASRIIGASVITL